VHELSIAVSIINTVEAELDSQKIEGTVTKVRVKAGKLSTVVPELLEFAFDRAKDGSRLSQSVLEIEAVPLVIKCKNCGAESEMEDPIVVCPQCGALGAEIISGKELNIVSLEVE
jgi:hydrogenase nickel incorporation protein HypA/HybF